VYRLTYHRKISPYAELDLGLDEETEAKIKTLTPEQIIEWNASSGFQDAQKALRDAPSA